MHFLTKEFDKLRNDFMGSKIGNYIGGSSFYKHGEKYYLQIPMPDRKVEDFEVRYEDGYIMLKDNSQKHACSRSYYIGMETLGFDAEYRNGMLTISFNKKKDAGLIPVK
jgi:HSP20 family molecular chaperone IbpA